MKRPFIKVCGMKDAENVKSIASLKPNFMGFIFYKKSKRWVADEVLDGLLNEIPNSIKKVGVFVNHTIENILPKIKKIDYIQLHGDESVAFCKKLKEADVNIIKAFGVDDDFDFEKLEAYLPYCDYFLFDTKTKSYGGSGKKYNWQKLETYNFDVPFFLSGGISVNDAEMIKEIEHPQLYAVDINSKFEIEPGLKNTEQVKTFIEKINKKNI